MSSTPPISVLIVSALAAALCALVGLLVGWWLKSLVIFFDGAYSLFSYAMSMVSVLVAVWVRSSRSARFVTGRRLAEPLAVMLKGLMILAMVLVSAVAAAQALLAGGRQVAADLAVLFGVFNVLFCALTWWYLWRQQRRHASALIAAETHQWAMDTLISLAVMLGFALAALLAYSPWSNWARYADPLMMLLVALFFLPTPIKMVAQAWQTAEPIWQAR